jgi:signal peptidase I
VAAAGHWGYRLAKAARRLPRLIEHGFALVGAVLLLYYLAFDLSVMVSPSMSPCLQGNRADDGDWVLTEKLTYRVRRPRRWEVVTFLTDQREQRMKRVVGLPGETVALADGEVVINGTAAPRPQSIESIHYYAYGQLYRGRTGECGDGYYVLGDDSKDSEDSRYEGPLKRKAIVGRAWLRVWPPKRIGLVNP